MRLIAVGAHALLTRSERHLLVLLVQGQTPAQAAATLCLAPEEARALVTGLLHRNGVAKLRPLLVRALVYGWVKR